MSDKPEPLAAILAEIRDFCSGWSEDVDVTVKVGLIYGWMCRIEAAAERERAALAAPARNCDRFNNATEAGLAYRNLVWARAGRVVDIDENTFFAHLANWLFAPAEGGDHA